MKNFECVEYPKHIHIVYQLLSLYLNIIISLVHDGELLAQRYHDLF